MAGVTVEHRGRIGDDVVEGKGQLAVDGFDLGAGGGQLLGLQELEGVDRRRDVAAVDFDELVVALVKRVRLRALDVERADHRAVDRQRDRQRAARARGALRCNADPWSCRDRRRSCRLPPRTR